MTRARSGIRACDYTPGATHVRAHLPAASLDYANAPPSPLRSLCGGIPLRAGVCSACANIVAPGGITPVFTTAPVGVGRDPRSNTAYFHTLTDATRVPVCGGKPFRIIPCFECLRLVDIHIALSWPSEVSSSAPGRAFSLCGRPLHGPAGELATGLPSPSRIISMDEAASWLEDDHPDLWRLCRVCMVNAPRHDRAMGRWLERAKVGAEQRAEREAAGAQRVDARRARRRDIEVELGVPKRNRSRPGRVLSASAQVSASAGELARRDTAERKVWPVEICDPVEVQSEDGD